MIAALFLACHAYKDAVESPGESAPVDGHTAETASQDSDTAPPETGESSSESESARETALETGDTGTLPVTWNPGDPIPGWEDFDCDETAGAQAFETRFPTLFSFVAEFVDPALAAWAGPHRATLKLRDCETRSCDDADTDLDHTLPYVLADLDGTWGDSGDARGQGWWGPDDATVRHIEGSGNGPLEAWSNDGYGVVSTVTTCVSRMRPDQVKGAVRVEVSAKVSTFWINTYFYPSVIYRLPFDITFDDRTGIDASLPDDAADRPETFDRAHFEYSRPYADAWPWDDITDPGVRAAVYERYRPYNEP